MISVADVVVVLVVVDLSASGTKLAVPRCGVVRNVWRAVRRARCKHREYTKNVHADCRERERDYTESAH